MNPSEIFTRVAGKANRLAVTHLDRRPARIDLSAPIVSFTFDDAPRSAFGVAREILQQQGAPATYYVSLGLLGRETEVGRIGSRNDLVEAVRDGCELGCHTFDHLDSRDTPVAAYMASVDHNRRALAELLPDYAFRSFAYPKNGPKLAIKSAVSRRFECCRSGGQATNADVADLNLVKAVFLDRRTGVDGDRARALIDDNTARRGWLVFATHDVAAEPTPYGCTPDLLESAARYAKASGAQFCTVSEALARIASGA